MKLLQNSLIFDSSNSTLLDFDLDDIIIIISDDNEILIELIRKTKRLLKKC